MKRWVLDVGDEQTQELAARSTKEHDQSDDFLDFRIKHVECVLMSFIDMVDRWKQSRSLCSL